MATTTTTTAKKKTVTKKNVIAKPKITGTKQTEQAEQAAKLESVDSINEEVEQEVTKEEIKEKPVVKKTPVVAKKEPKQFTQHDLILCRSVTAGWLGCGGKSGQYYIFENFGDQCEVEYQDLFALKQRRSPYLYAPLFVIEDEELLDNPRWTDIKKFYDEKVYTMDDINEILNIPANNFEEALKALPKGLAKSLQVEVAKRIENGTFDSLKKIKIIDEVCGTDFRSILSE